MLGAQLIREECFRHSIHDLVSYLILAVKAVFALCLSVERSIQYYHTPLIPRTSLRDSGTCTRTAYWTVRVTNGTRADVSGGQTCSCFRG